MWGVAKSANNPQIKVLYLHLHVFHPVTLSHCTQLVALACRHTLGVRSSGVSGQLDQAC